MSDDIVIQTREISKSFGKNRAVSRVNIRIREGEIFALVGPNGSGKTTFLKMLVGLLRPDSGSAVMCGHDIIRDTLAAKSCIGYVPDDPKSYEYLSGYEFLVFTGKLRGMRSDALKKRILEIETLFPISQILPQQIVHYSRGNIQKLAFLAAILTKPRALIVDEPIVGLDPESIDTFGQALKAHTAQGGSVLFTTHILDIARQWAGRGSILHGGSIVRELGHDDMPNVSRFYSQATQS